MHSECQDVNSMEGNPGDRRESTPLTARNQLLFQVLAVFLEPESKKISSA